jgi:hypothetical protein
MISDSIQSTNEIAAMQADCDAKAGINRYLIASDLTCQSHLNNEFSVRTKTFEDYLNWAEEKVEYKKIAVVILDRVGKLDKLGLHEYPEYGVLKADSLNRCFKSNTKTLRLKCSLYKFVTKLLLSLFINS